MSEPINLDLIELRCKLRGWECTRGGYGGVRSVTVSTPATWCAMWESGVSLGEPPDILTAPRWTLEKLLSEPPKGWIGMTLKGDGPAGVLALGWNSKTEEREVTAVIFVGSSGPTVRLSVEHTDDLARFAERHRAAAELAIIIAEI